MKQRTMDLTRWAPAHYLADNGELIHTSYLGPCRYTRAADLTTAVITKILLDVRGY